MKRVIIISVMSLILIFVLAITLAKDAPTTGQPPSECPGGAPLSEEAGVGSAAEARASAIIMVTAWLRPTGVKSPPLSVNGMYIYGDTDVRVSFRDNGKRITRVVTLTSTINNVELDRLARVASLFISGHSGMAEPEVRNDIVQAIAQRRSGEKLIAIKMYGTLGAVISAPEEGAVVISIERQKCG